jgi:hypothetical protein
VNKSWAYEFGLHTRRLGTKVRSGINPFTGQPTHFPIDLGLSEEEFVIFRSILKTQGASVSDDDGFYTLAFPNGQRISIGAGLLARNAPLVSCAVELVCEQVAIDPLQFLLDFTTSTNMAIVSSTKPDTAAIPDDPTDPMIQIRWPNLTVVKTPDKLGEWLSLQIGGRPVSAP